MHADEYDDHARYGLLAMRRVGRRPLRAGGEAGFTMIEMLVASAVGLVVVGVLATLMTSVLRAQPEQQERSAQIQDGRVIVERIVRELRQSKPVVGATSNATQITVDAYTRSGCGAAAPTTSAALCRVTYSCTQSGALGSCTRRAGTGAAVTILTDLRSAAVFSYGATTSPTCDLASTATPAFVCLTLAYPAGDGQEAVTIEDSAYLRNPAS
jgi:prepilin-type N-terminal cleavage/methylation domain-containing protein